MTRKLGFLLLALLVAACGKEKIDVYRAPKAAEAPAAAPHDHDHDHDHGGHDHGGAAPAGRQEPAAAAAAPELRWKAPASWQSRPASGMRVATYAVPSPAGEGDLSVIVLEGEAGGVLGNVNRWRGQVGLPPVDEAGLKTQALRLQSKAGALHVVDLVGAGDAGMIAAILPRGGKTWFFKLTGPSKATASAKPQLLDFLRSLR